VCLLNYVVVRLSKTPRVGHLGVCTLLVVPTEVLPLLWRGAPASKHRSPAVAQTADRTAYDALINDHLDNNTLPCL